MIFIENIFFSILIIFLFLIKNEIYQQKIPMRMELLKQMNKYFI